MNRWMRRWQLVRRDLQFRIKVLRSTSRTVRSSIPTPGFNYAEDGYPIGMEWWLRGDKNTYRRVAWLRGPSDGEDHASFQIEVVWSDCVERLPEVYALEVSNQFFEIYWAILVANLRAPINLLINPMRPDVDRPDGKVTVIGVSYMNPPALKCREAWIRRVVSAGGVFSGE